MTATLAAAAAAVPSASARPQPGSDLRPDIQALRAIAVGSVLLYHLWPNRFTGGYVGVDVFFVISGFLITSHLLREFTRTGTIRVARFWARRAKRLLPASLTVLFATAIAVVLIVPEAWWKQFLSEVIASTLYVENWLLASNSVDYLALENAASPTQHFWTLSVEEQFYIALPLLLMTVVLLAGRRTPRAVPVLAAVLGAAVLASFAYSVWLTLTTPSVSYFSTLTRAWEFGAGALLAFVTLRPPRGLSNVFSFAGLALIAFACFAFSAETPFPGSAAAVPVIGTILVLWAGERSAVSRIGRWWPVAMLGYLSYAVYLWHWPLVALTPYVTGRPLSTLDKAVILALTLVLAWLSTRFIEEPVRFSPRLLGGSRRPRTVAAWCAAGMAVVVAFSAVGIAVFDARADARAQTIESVKSDPPDCLGAQAMDPALDVCGDRELGDLLVPDPASAKDDDDNLPECWGLDADGAKICTVAAPKGWTKRVIAVGDSHSNTLIGAYRAMAESQGWRMDVAGIPGCYLTSAEQVANSDSHRAGCLKWRAAVMASIQADPPDAIIVTHSSGDNVVVPGSGETLESATVDGLVDAWSQLPDVPIIAIRDNPAMTKDTMNCVAQHRLEAADACAIARSEALAHFDGQADAAARVPNAHEIDLTDFYCTADTCSPVIGNVLVYRDPRHVTATWVRTLTPYLENEVMAALDW
ncbi:acyltransferase family protein [Microbacterium sp. SSM24]|uniref:acyltransferase family protein n=1 Tax=Microbacterium sp. SSM24 TaxID=2991714 RepID=UPI0022277380|nr:acyltransferase family protein [Microbacterium sp. SSM24]MCW3492250.1 acyltransferase [Microbacterium sp. SSM24]